MNASEAKGVLAVSDEQIERALQSKFGPDHQLRHWIRGGTVAAGYDKSHVVRALIAELDLVPRAAVAELIEADREYDVARHEWALHAPSGLGEIDRRTNEQYTRLNSAKDRRAAAIARIVGAA
jgi:hypothetical protein